MALLAKLMRAMGSDTLISACASRTFPRTASGAGVPWLGMKLAELVGLDRRARRRLLPAQGPPLVASRLRQIAKRKSQINVFTAPTPIC